MEKNKLRFKIHLTLFDQIKKIWEPKGTLANYSQYVKYPWKDFYFEYDAFKEELLKIIKNKDLEPANEEELLDYDQELCEEIDRVNLFLQVVLDDIQTDLEKILTNWNHMENPNEFRKLLSTKKKTISIDQTGIEHSLRSIYQRCDDSLKFFQLNEFLILKIAKKLVKSLDKSVRNSLSPDSSSEPDISSPMCDSNFTLWRRLFPSSVSYKLFEAKLSRIRELRAKCIQEYRRIFRRVFPSLAQPELQFVKVRDTGEQTAKVACAFKLGLTLTLILWLIVDSNRFYAGSEFWTRPGIFLYSSIGCLVLFKFAWSVNVWAWSMFNVDYLSLLQFSDRNQMVFSEMSRASTLVLLFVGNVLLYQITSADEKVKISGYTMQYLSPLCLFITFVLALVVDIYQRHKKQLSRLFTNRMYPQFLLCLLGVVSDPITLRDTYAADVLTSFTKVINDSVYGACWLVSGSFLRRTSEDDDSLNTLSNFGSKNLQCTGFGISVFIGYLVSLPLLIRFAQCVWFVRTQGLFYPPPSPPPPNQTLLQRICRLPYPGLHPQVWNAGKYFFSMLVVAVGLSKPSAQYQGYYYSLIVFTTIYKAYWDVVKDWGLCLDPLGDISAHIRYCFRRILYQPHPIPPRPSSPSSDPSQENESSSPLHPHLLSTLDSEAESESEKLRIKENEHHHSLASSFPLPHFLPSTSQNTRSTSLHFLLPALIRSPSSLNLLSSHKSAQLDRSDSFQFVSDTSPLYTPLPPPSDSPSALFLRKTLMYPSRALYYLCILINILLRFLWVVSLTPMASAASLTFYTPALSIFLGAMEILRRALWGHFKMELEHIKLVEKGQSFFLQFHDVDSELAQKGQSPTQMKIRKIWKKIVGRIPKRGEEHLTLSNRTHHRTNRNRISQSSLKDDYNPSPLPSYKSLFSPSARDWAMEDLGEDEGGRFRPLTRNDSMNGDDPPVGELLA